MEFFCFLNQTLDEVGTKSGNKKSQSTTLLTADLASVFFKIVE